MEVFNLSKQAKLYKTILSFLEWSITFFKSKLNHAKKPMKTPSIITNASKTSDLGDAFSMIEHSVIYNLLKTIGYYNS
ncbi:MAG: hypothetical protein B7Y76_08705 [Sphingobacteriia bacterium 35-40-5]|nr:MAG: hypothetical protein B7Y76_08705 [Sphingobacteriia bacterium 35-40-5]